MKRLTNIALTLTILALGMNVYADGDTKKDSKKSSTEKVITKIENTFDTDLSLENWMTEIKEFSNTDFFTEETLELENWMTESFDTHSPEFVEAELVMEDWMTESFNTEDTFKEDELQLEAWMFDLKR
jgi:hypothetical protein